MSSMGGGGSAANILDFNPFQTHSFIDNYRVFFFTGPPLILFKYKIMLKCLDWASPDPPQKVKVHGLGLP